jgi:hypothetical protein
VKASRLCVAAMALSVSAAGCDEAPWRGEPRADGPDPVGRSADAARPYWLGPSYRGLALTATTPRSYIYGDCDAQPDSGCAPPYEVQHHSSCERNPLSLDVRPRRVFRVRGHGLAAAYPEGTVDVWTGRYTVTVFAGSGALATGAARRLRRRTQDAPPARLPAPAFPNDVLQELKRVVVARERLHAVDAIVRETGLSRAGVRMRLRIGILLGPKRLAGVSAPTRPWRVVRRERHASRLVEAVGLAETARRFGVSRAELRAMIERVRGLSGSC